MWVTIKKIFKPYVKFQNSILWKKVTCFGTFGIPCIETYFSSIMFLSIFRTVCSLYWHWKWIYSLNSCLFFLFKKACYPHLFSARRYFFIVDVSGEQFLQFVCHSSAGITSGPEAFYFLSLWWLVLLYFHPQLHDVLA